MSKRVSFEQRRELLNFMRSHEDLARGRVTGPDALKIKLGILTTLADLLNSMPLGTNKTPDKWYKCWQDWKCDVKAKCYKIKQAKEDGENSRPPVPLTPLELELMKFWGEEAIENLEEVCDPIQVWRDCPIKRKLQENDTDNKDAPINLGNGFPPKMVVKHDPLECFGEEESFSDRSLSVPSSPVARSTDHELSPDSKERVLETAKRKLVTLRNGFRNSFNTMQELPFRRRAYDALQRREELHVLKKAELEWKVKAAQENYYRAKLEREAAVELLRCNRAKREEAEIILEKLKNEI